LRHCAHQGLNSLADRWAVRFLHQVRLHHLSSDAACCSIWNNPFQAVPGFDSYMSGTGLMVLSWHHQQDQTGVSARITRLSPGAYLPPPSDRQGNLGFVALAYRG
jgi:hypothetical protein